MERTSRRVRFIKDFDYLPKPSITIAYLAGQVAVVRLECAEKAIAKGVAVPTQEVIPNAGVAARIASKVKKNA